MSKKTSNPWKLHFWGLSMLEKACPHVTAVMILMNIAEGIQPYAAIFFAARIVDELAEGKDPKRLLLLVGLALASFLLLKVMSQALKAFKARTFDKPAMVAVDHLFGQKLMQMDFAVLDDPKTNELLAKCQHNHQMGGYGIIRTGWQTNRLLASIVSIVSALTLSCGAFLHPVPQSGSFLWLNHGLVTLAVVTVMLLIPILSAGLSNHAEGYWGIFAKDQVFGNRVFSIMDRTIEHPETAADIRFYGQEKLMRYYQERYETMGKGSPIYRFFLGKGGLLYAASVAVSVVFVGFVWVYVGLKAYGGAFGIGMVTQYVGALTALTGGITNLLRAIGGIRVNAPFLETNQEFFQIANRMYHGTLATEKRTDRQYEVEFKDVSFRYPGAETYALRHVSMKFKVGERLAIVGMNGSGKTTFIKLLCRLYEPTEGEILLNGIDIRKYNYQDYMQIFSIVFQDFKLLSFPLAQNVAASAEYDKERVYRALKDAGFEEKISEMPKGIDTCLYHDFSDDGVDISGGEAQKIAIARALYKDAPFIILDEPTASLDPIAEAEIYEKFDEISGDRTAIYISHRLSSCKFCDEIAVFDEGQIVQQGRHEELLQEENGKYYELWNAQAKYYL